MEGTENQGTPEGKQEYRHDREEIYANAVRAGKRTYFFDVRATRAGDLYITITESKRQYNDDGTFQYKKHKIFLYKEDFEKFTDALTDSIKKVIELNREKSYDLSERMDKKFTDVSFEELGNSIKEKPLVTDTEKTSDEPSDTETSSEEEPITQEETVDAGEDKKEE